MNTQDFKRKLTAVFSADVAGYSRLMGDDESATVKTLETYKEVMFTLIKQHRGRVIDSPGDNVLAEFGSVVDAVQCGVSVQKEFQARNAGLPENRRMEFRVGINLGDVIEEEGRIYGDGVNIAARLEALAEPGGICVSKTAFDHIESKLPLGYQYLGEQTVKNIAKPVGAYRVLMEPRVILEEKKEEEKVISFSRRKAAIAGAIAALVLIVGLALLWNFYLRPPPIEPASVEKMAYPLPEKPSIAVLPFKNLSDDPKQEYLSDGISEAIISTLSKVPKMFVIAANSSFTYKGKPVKVQQVAEELGVRYVLEGSVQRSGERLRVAVQLVDALKGHHLWSERYDLKMEDLLDVQDEIAMNVVAGTQGKLTDGEQALLRRRETNNLKAYEKVMEAETYYGRYTREDNFKARQLYEEAIRLDPNYPGAYRMIGWCHFMDFVRAWSQDPAKSLELAAEYAQKALALDESNSETLGLWGFLLGWKGDHEKAIEVLRQAVEINPNLADTTAMFGVVLTNSDRYEEAINMYEKAIRLNPFPPGWYFRELGMTNCFAERYEEAVVACKKAIQIEPKDYGSFRNLAAAYICLGQEEEARTAAAEVLRLEPNYTVEQIAKHWKERPGGERFTDALRKAGLPDGKTSLPLPDKPSIAVLPFVNMSGDPEQEYFSDGITEEIITALSKIEQMFVIARNSTFNYKGKQFSIQQVGEELGVRYVLEGSVRRSGDRVRVTAQLVDAITGSHLWAERYDRELKDIFAVQDDITKKIVTALNVKLTGDQYSYTYAKGTDNLEAYLKLLQAAALPHHSDIKESNVLRRQLAEDAIALDPNYAWAYRLLGWTHLNDIYYGLTKDFAKSWKTAFELGEKAQSLDEKAAHDLLGSLYQLKGEHDKAVAEAERLVEIFPNAAYAQMNLGRFLMNADRPEEAIPFFKKGLRLDPYAIAPFFYNLGFVYWMMGQYEEAISICNQGLKRHPDDMFTHMALAISYIETGNVEEANKSVAEVLRINPKISLDWLTKMLPWKNKDQVARCIDDLRKAGLT